MRFLSSKDWPKPYSCAYEVWNYNYTATGYAHSQDYCELFWIESGEGAHLLKGERRYMNEGYFALIREDDWHGFSAWEKGGRMTLINFAFPTELWQKIRDNFFPDGVRFFDREAIEDREYYLDIDDRERIRQLGFDLAAGRWNGTNAAAFLMGTLSLLCNRENTNSERTSAPDWLLSTARAIESWPNFVGGVPEFVKIAGRSHAHVCRDCRRHLGVTPRELVNRARIRWASMQLETTPKQIIDIAGECGFENLGHFYKQFKRTHQTTPRQYRLKFGIPHYPYK